MAEITDITGVMATIVTSIASLFQESRLTDGCHHLADGIHKLAGQLGGIKAALGHLAARIDDVGTEINHLEPASPQGIVVELQLLRRDLAALHE